MPRAFLFLFSLLAFISCFAPHFNNDLLRVESYIQSDPARALKELPYYSDSLSSNADKGLYSLLYSMALDKNYIDLKNDSIIRPAVSYFSKHRDNVRTFLSYYYLGRIYENAEEFDQALLVYLNAESFLSSFVSKEYESRLYSAKARVFYKQLALDKALEETYKSKRISPDFENPFFYIRCCLDIIGLLNSQNRLDEAAAELDSLSSWIKERGVPFPSDYYYQIIYRLVLHSEVGADSLSQYYNLYIESCKNENKHPNSLLLTDLMIKMNNYEKAKECFDSVPVSSLSSIRDSIHYFSSATSLYKGLKDFDNYVSSIEESRKLIETLNMNIFNKDVRFLEERYNNNLKQERKKNKIILLSLLIGIMMAAFIVILIHNHKKQQELKRSYDEIRGEYAVIQEAVKNCGDESGDIKSQLNMRLQALAPYFQKVPTRQVNRRVLHNLTRDNQEMLRNVGLLYSLSFPKFIARLVESGLTAEEIGLCSLYASGFVTKELSDMIDSGSIYQINCSIREKLGNVLDGRTLPAWLRDSFKSCES
jgi:tetratricopeptide (TPR) repeat protein